MQRRALVRVPRVHVLPRGDSLVDRLDVAVPCGVVQVNLRHRDGGGARDAE